MAERIAITGVGAVTPVGTGADTLHRAAIAGVCGIEDGYGRCTDFNPQSFLDRREARRMDRFAQLALAAASEAVEQAGLHAQTAYDPERIYTIIGTAIGGLQTIEQQIEEIRVNGMDSSSPLSVPMLMANAAPAQIALRYGFQGEASALVAACSSGAQAVIAGVRDILIGETDVAIVGGAEATLTDFTKSIFLSAGALSPTGSSRPFHRQRDGFVMGEGAGVIVLEKWQSAKDRSAQILGELVGYGVSTDAFHITAPDPAGVQAARAIKTAMRSANINATQVGYVNAHGTGTVLNDAIEAKVLREVLGDQISKIPVSSSKSYLGHLVGAAGAVELIATLQALRSRIVPATYGLTDIDPVTEHLDHVTTPRHLAVTATVAGADNPVGLSNSLGFGGHNVTLAVRAT